MKTSAQLARRGGRKHLLAKTTLLATDHQSLTTDPPTDGSVLVAVATVADNTQLITASGLAGPTARRDNRAASGAFTVMELLVVIGIIALLLVLVVPAFTTIKSAGDVTGTAYGISGVLDQARSYAMANNTFVWVGFKEVDVSKDASVNPQTTGTGRVAVAVVASRDGTRGYDVTNSSLSNPAWTSYSNGANLVAISKLQRFENTHLATTLNGSGNQPPTSGNMARPYIQSNNDVIGNAPASVTPFDWPLGSALNAGQYSFQKVINFDPQGVARIQYSTSTDGIEAYMEVGLQQAHGTTVASGPNVVAVQINCMTGAIRTYRP